MKYWWVNHNQTFKYENGGNYIWSPKGRSGGGFNQFYQNMTLVSPGDFILSYAGSLIKAIGIITGPHIEAAKPVEFGASGENWERIGWYVPVQWDNLQSPIKPSEFYSEISALFPEKYSPLNYRGTGNQGCYLAEISEELFNEIHRRAKDAENRLDFLDEISIEIEEERIIQELDRTCPSETDKQQLIKARVGQGDFRKNVIQIERRCRVTGVDNPSFLIASHMKPWRESSNEERLDGYNGLLLSPHIDKLFDKNMISFTDTGEIIIYTEEAQRALSKWKIDTSRSTGPFADKHKVFLAYHRSKSEELYED